MRLCKLSQFRKIVFMPGSAPDNRSLRKKIDNGEMPGGRKVLGRYYIDIDEFDRINGLRDGLEAKIKELMADPLLKGLV